METKLIGESARADLIRSISDPEHRSMTLEQLAVVSAAQITLGDRERLSVEFTPTVPHCGMSTFIGALCPSLRSCAVLTLSEHRALDPCAATTKSTAALQD